MTMIVCFSINLSKFTFIILLSYILVLVNARGSGHAQWATAEKCNGTYLVPNGEYIKCNSKNVTSQSTQSDCPESHNCTQEGICCPTKKYVCSLIDDSGTFEEGIDDLPRFAWSSEIQNCWRFSYYGAKGNYNNFPNIRKCIEFCKEK